MWCDDGLEPLIYGCQRWVIPGIAFVDAGPEVSELLEQLDDSHYCVRIDGLLDGVLFLIQSGLLRGREIIEAIAHSRITGMRAYEIPNVSSVQSIEIIPPGELIRRFPILADVGFIKMDIEGAEAEVLPGLRDFFFSKRPTLLVAIHSFVGPMVARRVIFELEAVFSDVKPLSTGSWDVLCTWSSRG